jgi:hypothetical protein
MDRFQQMNHLSSAKRSNWIHFKEYDEITTLRKGYCVLFPEYIHIYSHEVNQQVQPKGCRSSLFSSSTLIYRSA